MIAADNANGSGGGGTIVGSVLPKVLAKPKPKVRPRKPAVRARPHTSGGNNNNSGGNTKPHTSGGGGGGGKPVSVAPKPKAPVIPSIAAFLGGDSAYQQALAGGKRTLADYISDIARRRTEATTQYGQTKSSMEHDRATQLDDLRQEYASRGLINSGLFGEAQGKFQQQFTDQLNSLDQQQSGLLADLLSQQKNYQREYDLAVQQAKQDALARRAAQYRIG